jgi:hypothetical protein
MKKVMLLTIFGALMMISSAAVAQTTANGTLTVTATVNGSIQLVFNSDVAGVPLSVNGSSTAALAFGPVSAFGPLAPNVVRPAPTATTFTVSSAVDVMVTKVNTASANYTLKAQLGAVDATNNWSVGGIAVTNAGFSLPITATGAYASNLNFPVAITIPFTTPSGTPISNTINYQATAN